MPNTMVAGRLLLAGAALLGVAAGERAERGWADDAAAASNVAGRDEGYTWSLRSVSGGDSTGSAGGSAAAPELDDAALNADLLKLFDWEEHADMRGDGEPQRRLQGAGLRAEESAAPTPSPDRRLQDRMWDESAAPTPSPYRRLQGAGLREEMSAAPTPSPDRRLQGMWDESYAPTPSPYRRLQGAGLREEMSDAPTPSPDRRLQDMWDESYAPTPSPDRRLQDMWESDSPTPSPYRRLQRGVEMEESASPTPSPDRRLQDRMDYMESAAPTPSPYRRLQGAGLREEMSMAPTPSPYRRLDEEPPRRSLRAVGSEEMLRAVEREVATESREMQRLARDAMEGIRAGEGLRRRRRRRDAAGAEEEEELAVADGCDYAFEGAPVAVLPRADVRHGLAQLPALRHRSVAGSVLHCRAAAHVGAGGEDDDFHGVLDNAFFVFDGKLHVSRKASEAVAQQQEQGVALVQLRLEACAVQDGDEAVEVVAGGGCLTFQIG